MGMYDTYGEHQLKVGECVLDCYEVGDKVNIADGVYLCPDGIVVVQGGIFVAQEGADKIFDKWGQNVDLKPMLEERWLKYMGLEKGWEKKLKNNKRE